MTILVIILVVLLVTHWLIMVGERKRLNIPGPVPLPIIGHSLLFLGDALDFLKSLGHISEEWGYKVAARICFERFVLLSHPKYFEPIMSSMEFITKGTSYYFLKPWLGQGLLTSTGQRWKMHRKFLTPAFHFNILQNFLPVFCKNAKVLDQKLARLANGTTDIELFSLVALAALDNVTESIMGVGVNAQKDSESQYVKAIEDLSNLVSERMRNPFIHFDFIFNLLPMKRRQDKALKILHGQTRKVIEARKKQLENIDRDEFNKRSETGIRNKHAFLDLLLMSEIDGQRIDDESIREEVDTFMFEGHDTTTSGIVFTLYCLSKHKDIQEKILQELKDIFGDDLERDPIYSELNQMKYLESVIKEGLRLYPSVPLIARIVTSDSYVDDMFLPKDTNLVLDIIHMQRRPEIFDNPLEFRPERFSSENIEQKNAFSWLPFSAGPRNCIGQKFAMMELKVTISSVVKNFIILPSEQEPRLCADLILRSTNGVHVKLAPRYTKCDQTHSDQ